MRKISVLLVLFFSLCSCNKLCNSGTLSLNNSSHNTIQLIFIDGVNKGDLYPGATKNFDLSEGNHSFQQVGISGGYGCVITDVYINECETSSFTCGN
jgi:hypothetical protein